MQDLQSLALEIKKESFQLNGLCDSVLKQNAEEVLLPVQEAAESVLKTYSLFVSGSYEIFSYSSAPFESAQQAAAELTKTIRNALHIAEDRLAELKEEQDQKRTVLANLRKDIKDYPRGLLQLKARLESELNSRIGSPVRIDILADVLELADERWRGAVEGYLNAQRFYLLVDPAYYKSALLIFDRIKKSSVLHPSGWWTSVSFANEKRFAHAMTALPERLIRITSWRAAILTICWGASSVVKKLNSCAISKPLLQQTDCSTRDMLSVRFVVS